jgi:uncharacterized protein YraI
MPASQPSTGPVLQPAQPPATTLLNENIHDGQINCLDRVGDWLELASPQIRARSEVLLLNDTRPGAEGQSGHAVIRQGDAVFDPATGRNYPSLEAYQKENPQYTVAGSVGGAAMARILSTEPGSPARQEAISRAGIPTALAGMLLADDPRPERTTNASNVRLRGGPGTDQQILQEMPEGTRLEVTGEAQNGFIPVLAHVPGQSEPVAGWVSEQYTTPVEEATAPAEPAEPSGPEERFTTAPDVRLRGGPGTDQQILQEMPEGTRLEVTGEAQNGFIPVLAHVPGQSEPVAGWVSQEYTRPAAGETSLGTDGRPSTDNIKDRTPRYAQGDSDWASEPLYDGQTTDTIGTAGCAVTSAAMAMSGTLQAYGYPAVTPADVDAALDNNPNGGFTEYSALRWGNEVGAGAVPLQHQSAVFSTENLDAALAQGVPVVMEVQVDRSEADPDGWMHYVCVVDRKVNEDGSVTYTGYDPGYQDPPGSGNAAEITFTVAADGTLHGTNAGGGTYDTAARTDTARGTGLHYYLPTPEMVAAGQQQATGQ